MRCTIGCTMFGVCIFLHLLHFAQFPARLFVQLLLQKPIDNVSIWIYNILKTRGYTPKQQEGVKMKNRMLISLAEYAAQQCQGKPCAQNFNR